MTDEEPNYTEGGGCAVALITTLLIALMALLCGCKGPRTVYVPELHTEYVTKTDSLIRTDSVYVKDSIYVEKGGDTVVMYKTRYVYRDRWRDRLVTDTLVRTDSVTVVREVEKRLTRWQKARMDIGTGALIAALLALLFWIARRKFLP